MSTIITHDGTSIYYKDWGTGQPIIFSHSWLLNANAWDYQLFFAASRGYRAIAYDRRGYGRSSQPWNGNTMDTYAGDLAELIEALDLHDVVLIGHSMGGGEVTRYVGHYGSSRLARVVLVGTIPPLWLRTDTTPDGMPIEVFDQLRAGALMDRSQFYKDLSVSFYGVNRPGSQVSQGTLDMFWLWSMQASLKSVIEGVKVFSETDLSEDLKKFDIPTLIIHGDDDQIVPLGSSVPFVSQLIKGATLKIYPGAPHGLIHTHKDQLNEDILYFLKTTA